MLELLYAEAPVPLMIPAVQVNPPSLVCVKSYDKAPVPPGCGLAAAHTFKALVACISMIDLVPGKALSCEVHCAHALKVKRHKKKRVLNFFILMWLLLRI